MAAMRGRAEVMRQRQQVDAVFDRVSAANIVDLELLSDLARYLCVVTAGHMERCVIELASEFCRKNSALPAARYANEELGRLQNINSTRLLNLLRSFEPLWSKDLEVHFGEELEALNSVYANRHQIAHGTPVGVTVARAVEYYAGVTRLLNHLVDLFDPVS